LLPKGFTREMDLSEKKINFQFKLNSNIYFVLGFVHAESQHLLSGRAQKNSEETNGKGGGGTGQGAGTPRNRDGGLRGGYSRQTQTFYYQGNVMDCMVSICFSGH